MDVDFILDSTFDMESELVNMCFENIIHIRI